MNPSQQGISYNTFPQSRNMYINDFNTYSQNHSVPLLQKPQEYEQNLLDDMSNSCQNPLAQIFFKNQIQTNQSIKKDNFSIAINQQNENYPTSFAQQSAGKSQKINQIVSKFDQDLEKLMRLASNKPILQEKKSTPKEIKEKDQKNRKTMSRLSQQFFPKGGCQAIESGIKQKLKSRQTIGGFGMDKGRNRLQQNLNAQNNKRSGSLNLMSELENLQAQKMQIQQQPYHENTQQNFMNNPTQLKYYPEKQNMGNLKNQQNISTSITEPLSLTKSTVQVRLSEVKRQRERLSMGRDNLMNFIRTIDEQEKKKDIKVEKHKQRVTIDLFNIVKFIQQTDNEKKIESKNLTNQQNFQQKNVQTSLSDQPSPVVPLIQKYQQKLQSRRMTQFMKPLQPEKVIIEDERQDDFTPMKVYERQRNKFNQKLASLSFQKKKKIDYQKYVFDEYLGKIKEKIAHQRKVVEDLKKQRQQVIADNAKSLVQFTTTQKNLQQMENEKLQIRRQINHLKQRLNPNDYMEYKKIINEFQLKFAIKIHRFDQIIKSNSSDGFYVQFTIDNLICRIKRNSPQEPFAIRFQPCLGLKNQDLYLTSFGYQWRTLIYNSFIHKKLLKTTHFLSFLVNFSAYIQQLNQLQLSYDFISNMYEVRDPLINESSMNLEFELVVSNKNQFLWKVDLMKLRENEGIQITKKAQNQKVEIPEQILKWNKDTNKLLNSINFIIKYCHECMCKQTERQIEMISNVPK